MWDLLLFSSKDYAVLALLYSNFFLLQLYFSLKRLSKKMVCLEYRFPIINPKSMHRWWWQSGSQQSRATSRFAQLVDALQQAGKYDFASELKRSFLPDALFSTSPDPIYSSSSPANQAFVASPGLGGQVANGGESVSGNSLLCSCV